jgi:hypothetical protein
MTLGVLRQNPLFGVGSGLLSENIGLEAHNSFVHCYGDMGFFGGTLFLGMYASVFWGLFRVGSFREQIRNPDLRRMQPYLVGIATGYTIGMMSISRAYINPTYLVPGLVAAYLRLLTDARLPLLRFDSRLVWRLVAVGVAFLAITYIYVRTFARFV